MRKILAGVVFLILGASQLQAQPQNYKLHPLFIFSFTRYVQWPAAYNEGDFEITVLGDSPIVEELNKMAQLKKVGERAIKINKINAISEIKKCNILFVSSKKSAQLAEVLSKVATQSILVITEDAGLATKGSDINFIVKEGKLAFELNQAAVGKRTLKVSNELARLAIVI